MWLQKEGIESFEVTAVAMGEGFVRIEAFERSGLREFGDQIGPFLPCTYPSGTALPMQGSLSEAAGIDSIRDSLREFERPVG